MNTDSLLDFNKYVEKEILPATKDLEKLADTNRKHVQKLVYTNLVDRFDSMIDGAILSNCRDHTLVEQATKRLTQPITESDLLQLLLRSEDMQDALNTKLKDALRESVLRERHSRKLRTLFGVLQPDQDCWNVPSTS